MTNPFDKYQPFQKLTKPLFLYIEYEYLIHMTEEEIVGIIPNTKSGFLGQKAYNLIVTNHRLIVAELTKDMLKDEAKRVTDETKEKGEGIFSRMAKTMSSGTNLYQKYYSMPIESILTENPGNYSITVNDVKKIKIKLGMMYDDGRNIPNEITIKWANGKESFKFSSSTNDAKNILKKTFGNLVK